MTVTTTRAVGSARRTLDESVAYAMSTAQEGTNETQGLVVGGSLGRSARRKAV